MSGMKNVDLLSFQDFTHESSNSNENRSGTAARIDVESVHGSSGYTQPTSYETNINIERDEPLDQENKDTNHNFWSIKYYQKYFDVQTGDVIERIISSVVPHKVSSSFFDDSIRCKPDLYGPMWISITLILTIGVSGNISNYLQNTNKNIHWRYDFHLLSYAATAIFCYVWIVPLALWAALKFTSAEEDSEQIVDEKPSMPSMIALFCLYGYSLSIYIPVCILWSVQIWWLQWFLVIMAALVSGAVLIYWLLPLLKRSKYYYVLVGGILGFHFLLATGFMLYFFHVPSTSETIVTTTTTTSTVKP